MISPVSPITRCQSSHSIDRREAPQRRIASSCASNVVEQRSPFRSLQGGLP